MPGAKNHQELVIWRLCDQLRMAVIAATATGVVSGNRRFCDQIRTAVEDALSDIAEGYARFYPREFARFLDFAISSLTEVRDRTEHGYHRGYFSDTVTADLLRRCAATDRSVRKLRSYLWSVDPDDVPAHKSRPPHKRPRRR